MNIEYLENTFGSLEPLQISVGCGIVRFQPVTDFHDTY